MSHSNRDLRVFVQNPDDGEPKAYCGRLCDTAEVLESINNAVRGAIEWLQSDSEPEPVNLVISVKPMTDDEVEALPDM